MTTTTYRLIDLGTDLSSRHRASGLRNTIIAAVEAENRRVRLDFTGVRTVSSSFADELIAVLVMARGEDWFRRNVAVVGTTPEVRTTILESVADRLSERETI
ncbi:MAG: STAS-like domain-containing protein [Planctomycetaceae bacterium]|nr:STAS-like domain-containing protein [Planctomycetaceae bacterium]